MLISVKIIAHCSYQSQNLITVAIAHISDNITFNYDVIVSYHLNSNS